MNGKQELKIQSHAQDVKEGLIMPKLPKNIKQFIRGGKKTRFKKGHVPWMKGRHHTEKAKRILSEKSRTIQKQRYLKGEWKPPVKNRTYEEFYGAEKTKKIKEKQSGWSKKYGYQKGHKSSFFGYQDLKWKRKVSEGLKKSYKECKWKVWSEGLTKKNNLSLREMSKKMSKNYLGKNNPSWQGGISFEPYSPEFNKKLKLFVKQRDNFACKLCNSKDKLSVHHIDYNKKNSDLKNLILLCRSCNCKVNTNRNYWIEYFKRRLNNEIQNRQQIVNSKKSVSVIQNPENLMLGIDKLMPR